MYHYFQFTFKLFFVIVLSGMMEAENGEEIKMI